MPVERWRPGLQKRPCPRKLCSGTGIRQLNEHIEEAGATVLASMLDGYFKAMPSSRFKILSCLRSILNLPRSKAAIVLSNASEWFFS